MHAGGLFFVRHVQCAVQRAGKLLDVVRVDKQCIVELKRRSRKCTEDQDAVVVFAGSDKLFGDKIHTIVKRRDQATPMLLGNIVQSPYGSGASSPGQSVSSGRPGTAR